MTIHPSNKPPTRTRQILASGNHAFLRGEMLKMKIARDKHNTLQANPNVTRDCRLLSRAYAGVYGVKFEDANDPIAGPLTPFELARLPRLRREIRKIQGLPHPSKLWWTLHPWAWVNALVLGSLFIVAFGVERPWAIVVAMSVAAAKFFVTDYRWIAGFLFFAGVIYWLAKAGGSDDEPPVATTVASQRPRQAYRRKSDDVHGAARAADDWEIDEALRDKTGGFRRIFPD